MVENGSKTRQVIEKNGGASRDRTDDLIVANDALSQLSYSPPIDIHDFIIAPLQSGSADAARRPLNLFAPKHCVLTLKVLQFSKPRA
jgi:hypothetical protein